MTSSLIKVEDYLCDTSLFYGIVQEKLQRESVDAETGRRLSQIAETAVNEGVQVDARRYQAA
jgi:hypothetical protein